jgi:hypothetical protein
MTIAELIKGGLLKEIEPEKVSLVKSPANQRRFIFTKAAELEFTGSTDQTFDGTSISVNGEELEGLESFNFSLVNWSEEEMEDWGAVPVSMSWTIREASEDGLDKVEMYSLHSEVKKTMNTSDVLKNAKDDLGVDLTEDQFDKLSPEKQKALNNVAVFSKVFQGQPVFRDAVSFFVKSGTEAEEEKPADPPNDPPETPPEAPKIDTEQIVAAIHEGFASLKKEPDKKPDESEPDDNAGEPVTKADLEGFQNQLSAIAKAAGVKESGETDFAKGEWASIKLE